MSFSPSAGQRSMDQAIQKYNGKPDILTGEYSNLTIVLKKTSERGNLGHLFITTVDPQGHYVSLLVHPPPEHESREVRIQFDPPLKSPWEVKAIFEQWEAEAKRNFKIPDNLPINYYSPPPLFPMTVPVIIGLSALIFADMGRGHYAEMFRAWIVRVFGKYMIRGAEIFAAFMHLLSEPVWMLVLLRRHQTPWSEGWKWVLTVMLLGAAGVSEFNDCVEYERLSYIYSQTEVGPLPPRLERKASPKVKRD
ncbi:hypothetical protein BD324DRAFT_652465 [Kockovaella imperatae]|uniref:DUF2470 domain-containing protein n=1 Tax=Kockovaella imperatae TaxID=4999 RepID=A0A1Y1UBB7_9TREE|nr:hypothetical protein BD324DRAFT_652465 [Kockovaella imperatae]ORX35331.1 hypothetical protein BD324DRAFT_652465 [Kockovaella imperatae]